MLRAIDSNNLGVHSDPSAGAFVLARWQPVSSLLLSAGGRLDYDPSYKFEPTPQLSIAYNRGIVSAYVGTGRAVRAPNYVERYYNTLVAQPQGNLGNPDLDVETAWTHEAGLSLYPVSGITLHATAFTRTTWDLIDYARFDAADPVFLARNLHEVHTRGLEFDAEAARSFGAGRVRAALSLAVFDSTKLGSLPEGVQYKYALTNARRLLQGMAAADLGPISLGFQGLWKDPIASESYAVLNLQLGYRFHLGRQRLTLRSEIRNLFDEQYSDVFDAPMPGRWWIFGVRLVR
jgi:iron complex outermembrane receptor protein